MSEQWTKSQVPSNGEKTASRNWRQKLIPANQLDEARQANPALRCPHVAREMVRQAVAGNGAPLFGLYGSTIISPRLMRLPGMQYKSRRLGQAGNEEPTGRWLFFCICYLCFCARAAWLGAVA
jgi:hypothetical protein